MKRRALRRRYGHMEQLALPLGRAIHISASGKARNVKNLGWLLKHWKEVERFTASRGPGTNDAYLVAHLRSGARYETPFASKTVLKDWLHRPVFRGVPLNWFGEHTEA